MIVRLGQVLERSTVWLPLPADAEACCRVYQVCCCTESREWLLLDWQWSTHWNVTPLLLMDLKHTDNHSITDNEYMSPAEQVVLLQSI